MDLKSRLPHLMEEYSSYPPESLKESVLKISKRLGGDRSKDAVTAIETGDFAKAIEIVLHYYDKTYLFGLKKKESKNVIYVTADSDDVETNALKVLEAAGRITW
jgi:tRNA 2-selenouridine synthase